MYLQLRAPLRDQDRLLPCPLAIDRRCNIPSGRLHVYAALLMLEPVFKLFDHNSGSVRTLRQSQQDAPRESARRREKRSGWSVN